MIKNRKISKFPNSTCLIKYDSKVFNSIEYRNDGEGSVERYEYLEDYLDVPTND